MNKSQANTNRELNYRLFVQREESFERTNIQSEFARYDDIKNGDIEKVKENFAIIKANYYEGKGELSKNPLRNNIYHFIVSVAITARVCIYGGMPHDESYTLSDIYIRKADACKTPEEVIDLLGVMQVDYATRMHEIKIDPTISVHVKHAIDYIYDHLQENITLEALAKFENLNPSYFSKLFSKETGSSVKAFVNTAKVTTAQRMLAQTDYSISDIALSLGFSSQSAFTAVFRKQTGQTPGKYRNQYSYKYISLP